MFLNIFWVSRLDSYIILLNQWNPLFYRNLLLGLACNESTAGLYLDLSSNTLGAQGAHVLESCIHGVRVLQSLDISDNSKCKKPNKKINFVSFGRLVLFVVVLINFYMKM